MSEENKLNPYKVAFVGLQEKSEDDIKTYLLSRLSGLESKPMYNWVRNQEPPEAFLIWAYNNGKQAFKKKLAGCFEKILDETLSDFFEPKKPSEVKELISRLLYLGEMIFFQETQKALRKFLRKKEVLDVERAIALSLAKDVPWADTLLHQALSMLAYIENSLRNKDQSKEIAFWEPIMCGHLKKLPQDLRIISFHALGRIKWKLALEKYLPYFLEYLTEEYKNHNNESRINEKLVSMLYFFVKESDGAILEDPTPIVEGFSPDSTLMENRLEKAMSMLCRFPELFNSPNSCKEWKEKRIPGVIRKIHRRENRTKSQRDNLGEGIYDQRVCFRLQATELGGSFEEKCESALKRDPYSSKTRQNKEDKKKNNPFTYATEQGLSETLDAFFPPLSQQPNQDNEMKSEHNTEEVVNSGNKERGKAKYVRPLPTSEDNKIAKTTAGPIVFHDLVPINVSYGRAT